MPPIDYSAAIFLLTILATAVMAASAAIQGVRQNFDPFGVAVLAVVTAVGGGTLRDLLIGNLPVFWLRDFTYLATAIPVGLLGWFFSKRLRQGNGRRLRLLMYLDAIGLALFTLVGIKVALDNGISPVNAVVLGCITGVAGGMFRDVLCGQQPAILKHDLYATISLVGGGLYVACAACLADAINLPLAFVVMTLLRFAVIWRSARTQSDPEAG